MRGDQCNCIKQVATMYVGFNRCWRGARLRTSSCLCRR